MTEKEILQVNFKGLLYENTEESIFLSTQNSSWGTDIEYNAITAIDVIVETDFFEFENCIEVTHIYDGEESFKTYYAPQFGEVATDIIGHGRYSELFFTEETYLYTDAEKELIEAAKAGDLRKLQFLIGDNINIDCQNDFGITPLMEATRSGHKDIVSYLLKQGANPNIKAKNGESALIWAVDVEEIDIVNLLINADSNLNVKGAFDRTPLWIACKKGNVSIARLLLNNGAIKEFDR